MKRPRILALVGPTASGKTSISLHLAGLLNGEIVSADSRQIYKYLDIGTAKPSAGDRRKVKHHFIDVLELGEYYSAGQYGQDARTIIGRIFGRGKLPILVGGSGLYVRAVIDGLFEGPGRDAEIRGQLMERLEAEDLASLLSTLKKVDPASAAKMREPTARRVIRALEVFYLSGRPLSELQARQAAKVEFTAIQFGLDWERKELYDRINQRVDRMISDGLVDEVRDLQKRGYDRRLNALNTVGYKEVFDYLEGSLSSHEMVALIKQNTRRFAKRQMTWFRADKRIQWIPMSKEKLSSNVADAIAEMFRRSQRKS